MHRGGGGQPLPGGTLHLHQNIGDVLRRSSHSCNRQAMPFRRSRALEACRRSPARPPACVEPRKRIFYLGAAGSRGTLGNPHRAAPAPAAPSFTGRRGMMKGLVAAPCINA